MSITGLTLVLLRLASISPEGSAWSRELKAFGRDLETRTEGRVQVKWYFGSVAGDDAAVLDRIKRNQLDGSAGSAVCDRLAPSLRVARVVGLIQSHEEAAYVIGRMRRELDTEFRKSGFLGYATGLGSEVLFSMKPIRSMDDLRAMRTWLWDLDAVMAPQLKHMGIPLVQTPIEEATRALDDKKYDGFITIPQAALAFQWSARMSYFGELRSGFVMGCIIVANRVADSLPVSDQQALKDAAAKLQLRVDDLGRAQDAQLIGKLFEKQGLKRLTIDRALRAQFFEAARKARAAVDEKVVPLELIQRVESWLADWRAEHAR
jgi:TRAP-type C4-dicarboxylate transport system substrate-binding protein